VNLAGAEVSERLWVVPALIIINLLVFGVTAAQVNGDVSRVVVSPLFLDWAMWPQGVALGQWWRLLTAGFLHLGLIHLLVNMVSLWIIGRDVERALGAWRFLAVYLVSLLGGSVAIQLFSENGGAGASGAIYGVMGALTVLFLRTRMNPAPALGMIAINLVISVSIPGISLVAHLGGLALGVAVTAGMVYPPAPLRNRVQLATVVGLVVLLIGLVLLDTSVLGQLSS
jgi:membrane associated rhomboid family serine protease